MSIINEEKKSYTVYKKKKKIKKTKVIDFTVLMEGSFL